MDSNGAMSRYFDESLAQTRELPQIHIAPLRQPVSSHSLSVPSPLEPNASSVLDPKANSSGGNVPSSLPTLTELLDAARSSNNEPSAESRLSLETPPRPILPAFVNLRAIERFSYSFHEDSLHNPRKRRRIDAQSEPLGEHLQLPVPQSQKEQRPPPFGPFAILNGLNEPPPNAALLPPIESGSVARLLAKPTEHGSFREPPAGNTTNKFDTQQAEKRQGRIEDILDTPVEFKTDDSTKNHGQQECSKPETEETHQPDSEEDKLPLSPKSRGRSRKNTRKWTEEETTALLKGVAKCGIGNWKAILAQPELKFDKRSAANLKDRFRVCCPWAYKASDPVEATKQLHSMLAKELGKAEPDGSDGKTILPGPWLGNSESSAKKSMASNSNRPPRKLAPKTDANSNLKTRKRSPSSSMPAGPAHIVSTKSKPTLASQDIPAPDSTTVKSKRRVRHPFTVTEDEALLKGYSIHGYQWTLIQQDRRLNLGHRKPTHLRDRFRTKFPSVYNGDGTVGDRKYQKYYACSGHPSIPEGTVGGNYQPTKQITFPGGNCNESKIGHYSNNNNNNDDTDNSTGRRLYQHQNMLGSGTVDLGFTQPAPYLLQPSLSLSSSLSSSISSTPTGINLSSTANIHFPMAVDENVATNSCNSSSLDAATWEDNTLPPMAWDEFS